MKYFVLLISNIKKQKGSYLGLFFLMVIISATLCGVLSIWESSNSYIEKEEERLGIGEIIYWTSEFPEKEAMKEELEKVKGVGGAELLPVLYMELEVNGKESTAQNVLYEYQPSQRDYHIFKEGQAVFEEGSVELKEGEVLVPISFRSIYDVAEGDTVSFYFKGSEEKTGLKIRGFFEDPLCGSSMMGVKNILIGREDFQRFREKAREEKEDQSYGYFVNVSVDKESQETAKQVQSRLGEETEILSYQFYMFLRESLNGFMMILQKIIFAFLLAFSIILFAVAMIVAGHSITSSIEQNYVNLGILKALGFTQNNLRVVLCMQYMSALVLGVLPGIVLSKALIWGYDQATVTVNGILPEGKIPVLLDALGIGGMLLLMFLYIVAKSRKIGKITPLRAIRGNKEEIFFDSRMTAGIHGKGLHFWLALRQVFSGKKQYVGTCLIAALLVFFLSLGIRVQSWIGEDGAGLMNSMGMASVNGRSYDFSIEYKEDGVQEEAEAVIRDFSEISAQYQTVNYFIGRIKDTDCLVNVISNPEYYHILEGRTCKYENEVVVTQILAEENQMEIGDTVSVSFSDGKKEYLVTGISQCANEMGMNFGMSKEGYERLAGSGTNYLENYQLSNPEKKEAVLEALRMRYKTNEIVLEENTWSGIDGVMDAINGVELLMYVISAVFILVAVCMAAGRILYKEQQDMGIYKALGFLSGHLRLAFAIRFGIVSVLGAVLGILLSAGFNDRLVGVIFRQFGVTTFSSSLALLKIILPAAAVVLAFFVFAYLAAGRVKKTDPGILITE